MAKKLNKAKKTKIQSFLSGIGFLAMGIFTVVVNIPQVINAVDVLNNGIETTATITDIRRVRSRGGNVTTFSYTIELDYFVDGILYQNEIRNFSETNFRLTVGQEISIHFSSNNHNNILTSHRLSEPVMIFLMPTIFLVIGGGVMTIGLLVIVGKLNPFEEKYKIKKTLRPDIGLPIGGSVVLIIGIAGYFHGRDSVVLLIFGLVAWIYYINKVVVIKDDHFTYRIFPKRVIYYRDIKTIRKVKKAKGDATGKYKSFLIVLKNGKDLGLRDLKYLENLDNEYNESRVSILDQMDSLY